MSELYEQRIDAMKVRERSETSVWCKTVNAAFIELTEKRYNAERLAADKRKRAEHGDT